MEQADEHKIREYLLGQLPEAEEEQVEVRLLTEPGFAEEYDILVNELTDDYVAGKFEGDELERVELHFFKSTERRNKLGFAWAWKRYLVGRNQQKVAASRFLPTSLSSQSLLFRAAAVVALLAILVGALWFFRQRTSSPDTLATITLNIRAGDRAGGTDGRKVSLSPDIAALKIVLRLPEPRLPGARYRVEIENQNGDKKTLEPASQDAQSVTVVTRATGFSPGQYSVKLFVVSADSGERRIPGNYFFTVE